MALSCPWALLLLRHMQQCWGLLAKTGCGPYPRDRPHLVPVINQSLSSESPLTLPGVWSVGGLALVSCSPEPPNSMPGWTPLLAVFLCHRQALPIAWRPLGPCYMSFNGSSHKTHLPELTFRAFPDLPTPALQPSSALGPKLPATSGSPAYFVASMGSSPPGSPLEHLCVKQPGPRPGFSKSPAHGGGSGVIGHLTQCQRIWDSKPRSPLSSGARPPHPFPWPAGTRTQTLALPQDSIFNCWTANSSLF